MYNGQRNEYAKIVIIDDTKATPVNQSFLYVSQREFFFYTLKENNIAVRVGISSSSKLHAFSVKQIPSRNSFLTTTQGKTSLRTVSVGQQLD